MSSGKKTGERRIRFVPGQGSFVFARSQPFHVILKDTGDPRIKTLQLEEPAGAGGDPFQINLPEDLQAKVKAEAAANKHSASSQIETILRAHYAGGGGAGAENPLDRVFFNIMEAADLTLDEAGPELQRGILKAVRHSFRVLVDLRRSGDFSSPLAQQKLKQVLGDLQQLRDIADQEIAARKREAK